MFEIGEVVCQVSGVVIVKMDDIVLLVIVVVVKSVCEGQDFFLLIVDYQEKFYVGGCILGGFFKCEGCVIEKEMLILCLIDCLICLLFLEDYKNEVQIIVMVMLLNLDVDGDILVLIGVLVVLVLVGILFMGLIGVVKVGYKNGEYILNLIVSELVDLQLELVVVGIFNVVLMVEFEVVLLFEEVMLGVVIFGYCEMQKVINVINELIVEVGIKLLIWEVLVKNDVLIFVLKEVIGLCLGEVFQVCDKLQCCDVILVIKKDVFEVLVGCVVVEGWNLVELLKEFGELEYCIMCDLVLDIKVCIDGCVLDIVCLIVVKIGVLLCIYGFLLFIRGEIQVIVIIILGIVCDGQVIDVVVGEYKENFLFYYNFFLFLVGECGCMMGLKCCEIGYGCLVKCGVLVVMLLLEVFLYIICVVLEIIELNGFLLMVLVCGLLLVLMDVGVLVKVLVVGIVMGLVKEGDCFVVLFDILGDEDYLGDMDFKVVGIVEGIFVLQMDIKIEGIIEEIMKQVLQQVKVGCLYILGEMVYGLIVLCEELLDYVLCLLIIKIYLDKICEVIGKGGLIIQVIIKEIGIQIDIQDDGIIVIVLVNVIVVQVVKVCIEQIILDVELGCIYEGKVVKIMDFGVFVIILLGKDGLVYVLQIFSECVEKVGDKLKEGDVVKVKVLEVDKQGCICLLMKVVEEGEGVSVE